MFRMCAFAVAMFVAIAALAAAPSVRGLDHGTATPVTGPDEEVSLTGTGVAFMRIQNTGAEDDVLLESTSDIANVVEVHEMTDVDGVMQMRPLKDDLTIPAGGEAILESGGYHMMLIGLKEDLTNGKTYDLTLHFAKAGEVTVPVTVRPRAALAADAVPAAPVTAGDITIIDPWSRPAPATGLGDMSTPAATPHS